MSEISGNDDYVYHGEQPTKIDNVLGTHLGQVLETANKLAASGYEAYGEIEGPDGQKYPIVADNHEIEPAAEKEGHYWLHHKLHMPGKKEKIIIASVMISGYTILRCIDKIRSRRSV